MTPLVPKPVDPQALERALAAARAELAQPSPSRSWQRLWGMSFAVCAGLGVAIAAAGWGLKLFPATNWERHGLAFGALVLCQGACLWSAFTPQRTRWRWAGPGMALVGLAAMLWAHAAVPDSAQEVGWHCTATHLLVDAVPLALALAILRGFAPSAGRAALAGLGMGATGAMMGEIVCGQGLAHTLVFHGAAWLALAIAAAAARPWIRTRSYAP